MRAQAFTWRGKRRLPVKGLQLASSGAPHVPRVYIRIELYKRMERRATKLGITMRTLLSRALRDIPRTCRFERMRSKERLQHHQYEGHA